MSGSSTSYSARGTLRGNVYISRTRGRPGSLTVAGAVAEGSEAARVLEAAGYWHTGGPAIECTNGRARYCPGGPGHWHRDDIGRRANAARVVEETAGQLTAAGYDVHADAQ